ncbi:MAG: class I tRNA ligase family protein, partial [Treponema sp.]|nr:class I tRNA ligase family protein [Treponema sp.]
IALIRRIEDNGFTYFAGGNLYFDTSKDPDYGKLALLKPESGESRARTEVDRHKRNARDFVLWFTKSKFADQALVWDSPWGTGYPGWHIECSAMGMRYLGEQFDIHAGGIDHIPVHHTNEIAQSQAATGKIPCVNFWMHNEFLVLDKGKMSKSKGEFLTLQKLVDEGFDPLDYRYLLFGAHYRSQLRFSWDALSGARNARKSLNERIRLLAGRTASGAAFSGDVRASANAVASYLRDFDAALCDDLATPRCLAALWGLLKDTEIAPADALRAAFDMDRVFGLGLEKEAAEEPGRAEKAEAGSGLSETERADIERLVGERAAAKKAKDFAAADAIRERLRERGIELTDGPTGTSWKPASGVTDRG